MANTDAGEIALFVLLVFFLLLLIGGSCGGGYYYYQNNKNNCCSCSSKKQDNASGCPKCGLNDVNEEPDTALETFTNIMTGDKHPDKDENYNALYTDKYIYTSPPGDVAAQHFANSGQGTKGAFLPLQGVGAQTYMANSTDSNFAASSPFSGKIGGQPNYTTDEYTTRWIGFNSFPFEENQIEATNSYTISGANERVCNPGQKCNLKCEDWFPRLHKDSEGYCVQGSDSMVNCSSRNVNNCEGHGKKEFIDYKNQPIYKTVLN